VPVVYRPSESIVILGAARTPQAPLGGALERFKATELGALAIAGALERAGLSGSDVDECIMGNVVSAGLKQAPAKQAGVAAGVPQDRLFKTVNTVCASGMTAIQDACLSLCAGVTQIAVAGGMESRSNAPYYLGPFDDANERLPGKVRGFELRIRSPGMKDPVEKHVEFVRKLKLSGIREASIFDSLVCPFADGLSMKDYAARYAEEAGLSLDEVNRAAGESYRRARAARDNGDLAREIVPAGEVAADEIISKEREADYRAISFDFVSAYNAPQLADGAAAVVLAREADAKRRRLKALARIVAVSRLDTEPAQFVASPVDATQMVIEASGGAITLIEANESFGLQDILLRRAFAGIETNPYGGAVALGHPVGASGARVVVTLLNAMAAKGHAMGAATICFGSGGAMAIALERRATAMIFEHSRAQGAYL
jgi:acetyl-CoA C-acetyltransferase